MGDPLTAVAVSGIGELYQLGAVVITLILVILGGAFIFRKAIEQCERRETRAIENWEKANQRSIDVIEKCSEGFSDMKLAVSELRAELRGRQ